MESALNSSFSPCLTPQIISQRYPRTPSPSLSPSRSTPKRNSVEEPPTCIKMEDLEQQSTAATLAADVSVRHSSSTPETSSPHSDGSRSPDSKPVKKRKSWGQVLPEPKTNLPPRKRAKTADEKEQRRIERVKRNRLAAHNSRERKRQEVEQLQREKESLEARLHAVEESNSKMAAELAAFRRMMPGVTPKVEAADTLSTRDLTPPHSSTSHTTTTTTTINPRQASFPSPESMESVDSPLDTSSQPATPASDEPTIADLDRTQHSAVMLCDLPCQSSIAMDQRWATIFWFLSSLQISSMMTALLSTIHSSTSTLSANLLPQLPRNLVGLARKRLSSAATPLSPRWLRSISLARRLSTCTPTQAQQTLLATSLALQSKSRPAAVGRILRARVHGRPDHDPLAADMRLLKAAAALASSSRRSKKKQARFRQEPRQQPHPVLVS